MRGRRGYIKNVSKSTSVGFELILYSRGISPVSLHCSAIMIELHHESFIRPYFEITSASSLYFFFPLGGGGGGGGTSPFFFDFGGFEGT